MNKRDSYSSLVCRWSGNEFDVPIVYAYHKVDGVGREAIFYVVCARCQELSEYLKAERPDSLPAFPLCGYEVIIKLAYLLRLKLRIVTADDGRIFAEHALSFGGRKPT